MLDEVVFLVTGDDDFQRRKLTQAMDDVAPEKTGAAGNYHAFVRKACAQLVIPSIKKANWFNGS